MTTSKPNHKSSNTKIYGRDPYEINRNLLAIQDYALHKALLIDEYILTQIIHQCDLTIVKSLLWRMAMKACVELNCSCNSKAKERAQDMETQTEMEQ